MHINSYSYYLTTIKVKCITFIISKDSKYTKPEVQFYINMFIKLACQFEEINS